MRCAGKQRDLPLADIGMLEKQMSQKTAKKSSVWKDWDV